MKSSSPGNVEQSQITQALQALDGTMAGIIQLNDQCIPAGIVAHQTEL
jgi:hypothetical protein